MESESEKHEFTPEIGKQSDFRNSKFNEYFEQSITKNKSVGIWKYPK